jgi:hypothetical protein
MESYPVNIDCEEVNIHLPSKTSSLTHFLPFLWKKKILNDDKASYCGGLPTLVYYLKYIKPTLYALREARQSLLE